MIDGYYIRLYERNRMSNENGYSVEKKIREGDRTQARLADIGCWGSLIIAALTACAWLYVIGGYLGR